MLSPYLKEQIAFVADYVGNESTDWVRIKTELLRLIKNNERDLFSRRHMTSQKQMPNSFDQEVIDYWKTLTGNNLYIPEDRLHGPLDVFNPKGWGIQKYNKSRAKVKLVNNV